jgi:hypothetical protein
MSLSLDVECLRALVGEAEVSLESARIILDESGVTPEDFDAQPLRGVWAVLEERVRTRRGLDGVARTQGLTAVQADVLAGALASPELGCLRERLGQLREASVRRQALDGLRRAAEALKSGKPLSEVAALASEVPGVLAGVRGRVRETTGDTMRIFESADAAWSDNKPLSLRTGWEDLDSRLRLMPQLHALGAQPGVGKSAVVAGLVRNWTAARVKVGVLAYEDDGVDMQRRILACDSNLSLACFFGDEPPTGDIDDAVKAAEKRTALEPYLLVDDAEAAPRISDAVASIRQMHARGCRAVILDNLSCVRFDGDERHHDIEAALIQLRRTALALRIPVIVVGHLKRGTTDGDELYKVPKLSDFAGAAAWERTSRSITGMWFDADTNETRMKILKQTNGARGGEFVCEVRASAAVVTDIRHAPQPKRETSTRRTYGSRQEADS